MILGTWNVQELKNKREIIIKNLEELKLVTIILTVTKKKWIEVDKKEVDSGLEMNDGFVHFYSRVPKEK